jgi:hypothetical protein
MTVTIIVPHPINNIRIYTVTLQITGITLGMLYTYMWDARSSALYVEMWDEEDKMNDQVLAWRCDAWMLKTAVHTTNSSSSSIRFHPKRESSGMDPLTLV